MSSEQTAYTVEDVRGTVGVGETTFEGKTARQAALKLARRLPEADSEADAKADPTEATIRSADSGETFDFDAWAWTGEPSGSEEWKPDEITEVSVEAKRLGDPYEWFTSPREAEQWDDGS
jgi:hypothetical protein